MPGLIFPGALHAGYALLRMPPWHSFLLFVCLTAAAGQVLAQATDAGQTDAGQGESSPAAVNDADGILSGIEITRRVLGGDDSERDAWPSVVAMVTPGPAPLEDRFYCAGTIVADRWVMTAAHCLFDNFGRQDTASSIRIIAGIHDLVADTTLDEVIVTNIIIHPEYDNSLDSPPNDIALLEVASTLQAPVGNLFVGESEDYVGQMGFIVGWGATRYDNDRASGYPTTQQEAPVPLVSLATCNSPISYDGLISVTQLCAGYLEGGIDTCAGDSGGPLYIIENGQVIQMGITSFGSGCGEENFFGIYTNVSHYIPWLSTYVPVPEQSAELIAQRESADNGGSSSGSSDSSGLFGAAMNPLYLLLLVIAGLARRLDGHRFPLSCSRLLWVVAGGKRLCLVPFALLLTACAVPSTGAAPDAGNAPEMSLTEKPSMSDAHTLILNADSVRAGVDGWQLGATHAEIDSRLTGSVWQAPVCDTGKTALRGTGRLFMTEHCSVEAAGEVLLQGVQVRRLEFFLLDQQLVRLDVALAEHPSTGNSSDLADLLTSTYGSHSEPRSEKAPAEQPPYKLWRHQDDQIRLYPTHSLQFIDTRLESSLPSLYDVAMPIDLD